MRCSTVRRINRLAVEAGGKCDTLSNETTRITILYSIVLVSRAGLEPATTALKDQNGLIAGAPSRDFSVHYGNAGSVDCPSVRPFGHRFGHNLVG